MDGNRSCRRSGTDGIVLRARHTNANCGAHEGGADVEAAQDGRADDHGPGDRRRAAGPRAGQRRLQRRPSRSSRRRPSWASRSPSRGWSSPRRRRHPATVVKIRLYMLVDGHWSVIGHLSGEAHSHPGRTRHHVLPPAHRPGGGQVRRQGVPLPGGQAGQEVDGHLLRRRPADHHRLQRSTGGWRRRSADTMAPADTPLDIVFTTPSDWASGDPAKHYGAAHFIWGDFEKVDADGLIWHTDGLRARPLRLDARRDAQVGHRLAWSSPSRSTSTRSHTPTPTRCRTCRRTSPSATSAPRAWAATAASRSSRASSRRRAPTRSCGTPTAWSPGATTGSAGWTTATSGSWWSTMPRQQVAIDSDPLRLRDGRAGRHAGGPGLHAARG